MRFVVMENFQLLITVNGKIHTSKKRICGSRDLKLGSEKTQNNTTRLWFCTKLQF